MTSYQPPWEELRALVARAVAEDMPGGDPTGAAVGPRPAGADMVARSPGTAAGLVAVPMVLDAVARHLGTGAASAQLLAADGEKVAAGQPVARLEGPAATLLAAERTALNIVGHLSGVATATAAAVEAVAGTGTVIRDTRKTLPGLRAVEKYAVRCGGGRNHRMSLSDAVLVKDNHVAALGGIGPAVGAARKSAGATGGAALPVEVEVDNLSELDEALAAGVDLVLVDNMSLADTAEAVRRAAASGARVEASGGIRAGSARQVAQAGVHYIAIGALTHSAPVLDVGLDWWAYP